MGTISGSCASESPGVARQGDVEISDNRKVLCQPCQPLQRGQPQHRAAPAPRGLLHLPLIEEELAEWLGCGVQGGLSVTQGTQGLWRCVGMLCRADCTQTCDPRPVLQTNF